jgi:PAS domain S-box-containing protein
LNLTLSSASRKKKVTVTHDRGSTGRVLFEVPWAPPDALFRLLVDRVRDYAIFLLNPDGTIASWNRGAERIKGYHSSEVIGRHFSIFYSDQEVALGKPAHELEVAAREGRFEEEGWRTRKDGTRFWAHVVLTAIHSEDGNLVGFAKVTRDLTERRQAEETVRATDRRFRRMIEVVTDYAIMMLDLEGRVASWNAGAERATQYSAKEILGEPWAVFYPPEDQRAGRPAAGLAQAAATGRFEEEGWRLRKDGSRFWASVVTTRVRDDEGVLVGYAQVIRDLTERRRLEQHERELIQERAARAAAEAAELRVRDSEERYRRQSEQLNVILEGVTDGITVHGADGRLVFVNSAAAHSAGFASREALLGSELPQMLRDFELYDESGALVSPDQLPGLRALRGEPAPPMLIRLRQSRTGDERWLLASASALADGSARPYLVVGIWHDVTARRRAELATQFLDQATALLASELEYPATLARLSELAVPRLADLCLVHVVDGEQSLRLVGVAHVDPAKAVLARTLDERYPPRPHTRGGVWEVVRTGRPQLHRQVAAELIGAVAHDPEHQRLLGELGPRSAVIVPLCTHTHVHGTMTLVYAESGRRYERDDLALADELARRAGAAVENALLFESERRAREEAERAIRLRDDFLSIAGHELRTPLTALGLQLSSLERIARRAPASSELSAVAERLQKVTAYASRLEGLIDELLDVSRITVHRLKLECQATDLGQLVREVADSFEATAERAGCSLALQTDDAVVGHWDRHRLEQVVTNLLANAIKYGKGKPIELRVGRAAERARLEVRDHGIGIAFEDQKRIFGRFERAVSDRYYGGLGIGLWVAREIVEAHGGSIRADSTPGEGATFIVELWTAPPSPDSAVKD